MAQKPKSESTPMVSGPHNIEGKYRPEFILVLRGVAYSLERGS